MAKKSFFKRIAKSIKAPPLFKECKEEIEKMQQMTADLLGITLDELKECEGKTGKEFSGIINNWAVEKDLTKQDRGKVMTLLELINIYTKFPWAKFTWQNIDNNWGRCLTGDTAIVLSNGEIKRIDEMQKNDEVLVLDEKKYRITKEKVKDIIQNGVKEIYQITTWKGRKIKCSLNHPFFTEDGWKCLKDIKKEDVIAVPRILSIQGKQKYSEERMKFLGYLLGDGYVRNGACQVINSNSKIIEELKTFDGFRRLHKNKNDKASVAIFNGQNPWLREIGIFGHGAYTKFIPDFVFVLQNKYVALMINRMFASDGWASTDKNGACEIGYCSISEKMIYQLQHLLLRFGILSRVRGEERKNKKWHKIFRLKLQGKENQLKFIAQIGIFSKEKKLQRIFDIQISKQTIGQSTDIIPKKLVQNCSLHTMRIYLDNFSCGSCVKHRNVGRDNLQKLADILNSKALKLLAWSDIYWDRVKDVKKAGREKVWDIQLRTHHNFIANDIFVHNSHILTYNEKTDEIEMQWFIPRLKKAVKKLLLADRSGRIIGEQEIG